MSVSLCFPPLRRYRVFSDDLWFKNVRRRPRVGSTPSCVTGAGVTAAPEKSVGKCWHASRPGTAWCPPCHVPAARASLVRCPRTTRAASFHSVVYKDGHVSGIVQCPLLRPTVPNVSPACMPPLAGQRCLRVLVWTTLLTVVPLERVHSLSVSPELAAPGPAGRSLTSCPQRRCVHVAVQCLGVLVSSTRALSVSIVRPLGRCPAQDGFLKVTTSPCVNRTDMLTNGTPGNAT